MGTPRPPLYPWDHPAFYPLCLIIVLLGLTAGLCAQEVPDRIVRALVAVESGCTWHGIGDIRGKWGRGDAGELSPFQLSLAALTDMRAAHKADRIHRDPVLAESYARLWLARCYEQAGDWRGALERYNGGTRPSKRAREYADRVLNLADLN